MLEFVFVAGAVVVVGAAVVVVVVVGAVVGSVVVGVVVELLPCPPRPSLPKFDSTF